MHVVHERPQRLLKIQERKRKIIDYNPKHTGLLELGLEPNYLTDDVLTQMMKFVLKHKDNIKKDQRP